jgi:hypothetical protein
LRLHPHSLALSHSFLFWCHDSSRKINLVNRRCEKIKCIPADQKETEKKRAIGKERKRDREGEKKKKRKKEREREGGREEGGMQKEKRGQKIVVCICSLYFRLDISTLRKQRFFYLYFFT